MVDLLILVEGQTEQLFVRQILAVELAGRGIAANARLLGKPGRKGGIRPYRQARGEMLDLLKERPDRWFTTMFDFYGLPTNWPGRKEAREMPCPGNAAHVEGRIHEDVCDALGSSFDRSHFIPYIQLHEFEALLFSDPDKLSKSLRLQDAEAKRINEIARQFGTPEKIDDSPATAPSKRILKIAPAYGKKLDALIAAKAIGLDVMRSKCPHFAEWLGKLERLAV